MDPSVSIVVPTRGRPEKLRNCLAGLSAQTVDNFDVLVAVDGPDEGEGALAAEVLGRRCRVLPGEQAGPAAARNRALAEVRGGLVLLLNDDVTPEPGLVEAHARAHDRRAADRPAMVLGAAPWKIHKPDRLFDRLVRERSLVFFYDQMRGPTDPDRDWGFRHAWTLNLSLPAWALREAGGFDAALPGAAFEDLEMAWRVSSRFGTPVLFRPEGVVVHDHRYEPAGYLERERRLGRDAWALSGASPGCAAAVFGRDIRSEEEVAYSRSFVERERGTAERLERAFLALAEVPADAVPGGEAGERLMDAVYGQHLLLKRWWWRRGLLEGWEETARGTAAAPA